MLSTILKPVQKVLDYFKGSEVGGALKEAVKKAREKKDAGFFEKIKIFWSQFWKEMTETDKEKADATKDATDAVAKTADDTIKDAKEAFALPESVPKEDSEFFDEVLAMGVAGVKDLDDEAETKAHSGLKKIDKAVKGEGEEELDIEESMAVAAAGISTLRQLRKRYGKEAEFKQALDRIVALSDKSKYPLRTLLTEKVWGLFRIKDDSEGLKFLERFGIKPTAADLAGNGDASHAKGMLESLSKHPVENPDEVAKFMKKYFFPNTSEGNVKVACETLGEMIVKEESKLETDKLAKLAFLISESDYEHLVNALVGQQTALADAA